MFSERWGQAKDLSAPPWEQYIPQVKEISFTYACLFPREPSAAQWGGCCCVTLRRPSNLSEPHLIMRIPTLWGCCGTQVQGMGNHFARHKIQYLPRPVCPLQPRAICLPQPLEVLTCLLPMYKTLKCPWVPLPSCSALAPQIFQKINPLQQCLLFSLPFAVPVRWGGGIMAAISQWESP